MRRLRYWCLSVQCLAIGLAACGASVGDAPDTGASDASVRDASVQTDSEVSQIDAMALDAGEATDAFVPTTHCADVCTDSSANPSNACGICMAVASSNVCSQPMGACFTDVAPTNATCLSCSGFLQQCEHPDGCPPQTDLCPASLLLIQDINRCLCNACGGGDPTVDDPGFAHCDDLPQLAPSPCHELSKLACLDEPGCRAIYTDPCLGPEDCLATPDFRQCVAVEATAPATGECTTLSETECATRDDCVAVHDIPQNSCCPGPSWAAPFLGCRPEPARPFETFSCMYLSKSECLEADHCLPVYIAQNAITVCGPYLYGLSVCPSCWWYEWEQNWGCVPWQ